MKYYNNKTHRILSFGSTFPSSVHPIHGVFVKERIKNTDLLEGCDVKVVSPVPYFPPIKQFGRWYSFSQIPFFEKIDGLEVVRPRYFLLPKIGALFHPHSMAVSTFRTISKIQKSFDFDLIDAHFVYPDGVAAALCAKKFNKPLVITGRGEDILRFPGLPVVGEQIRWALKQANALVALSKEISEAMIVNGAQENKITIIPNGVDCDKYEPINNKEARKKLELPIDRPIILSVGYRLERKGFHLLIDAVPEIKKQFPDILIVIVGGEARWGEDYTPVIKNRIKKNNIRDHVILAGPRPPEELSLWYSASDIFTLMTSREGSPNVVMEALSCGLPVVAPPVGGIPEILSDSNLGILLKERTAKSAANGVMEALSKKWDRTLIRNITMNKSWQSVAKKVQKIFCNVLDENYVTK